MSTLSSSGKVMDARSGGKIVKRRRRVSTTPYDRPPAPPQRPPESPNWLTGVIFPATRMIASGAAKILSSVFDSHSSSSSSSSNESDANYEDNYDNADDVHYLNEDNGTPSDAMRCITKEPKKWDAKNAIEQLFVQGIFSREERDRFVEIINSRLVHSATGREHDGIPTVTPDETIGNATDDLCSKAVREARTWLEEKKLGSSPMSDMADGSRGFNSIGVKHIDNEAGSPVDVAKSYMRSRPPWASASSEHTELQTPSTMRSQLIREGPIFLAGDEFLSSVKKRPSLESGSWNIQEEIRRVRLKATEDMLHSLPSTKIDLSSFALSPKHDQDTSVANLPNSIGDEGKLLNYLTEKNPVDDSPKVDAKENTTGGISALEPMQEGVVNEGLMSNAAILISEQHQDPDAIKIAGSSAASESCHSASPDLGIDHCTDPQSTRLNDSPAEEVKEADGTHNVNEHPNSQTSLSSEVGTGEIHGQLQDESPNAVKSDEKTTPHVIPNLRKTAREADGTPTKQDAKIPGRYNRRGRGRGK